jgi:hypothetical protein
MGAGVPKNFIDNNIYQQTDIYHSLKRKTSDKFIAVPKYNDIFLGNIQRPFATHSLFSDRNTLIVVTKKNECEIHLNGDDTKYTSCEDDSVENSKILNSIANERAFQYYLHTQNVADNHSAIQELSVVTR